jgi:hypothetical protein
VAKKLTKALYLVTTHVHPEHDLGAQAFSGTTTLIRSTDQVKDIAEFGLQLAKVFASRSTIHAELLKGADFRKADITFERDYDLDLGGVQAKLTAMARTIRPAIRLSGSSPTASCLPAISPCALNRSLRAPHLSLWHRAPDKARLADAIKAAYAEAMRARFRIIETGVPNRHALLKYRSRVGPTSGPGRPHLINPSRLPNAIFKVLTGDRAQ